jgi:pimeloyl-ACP methyl ester carboxylesterase
LSWKPKAPLNSDALVSRDRFVAASKEIARDGVAHFQERNVVLTGYTTVESADDLNDIRVALGIEKLNLFGFSYGTHLALATIRRHGDHLANVVVFGTEGPDHTRKLPSTFDRQWERIAELVRRDPAVSSAVPDLAGLTRRVLDQLEKEPVELEITDRLSGGTRTLSIGPFGLQLILIADMGDTSDIPVLPRLVYSIDKGDYAMLRWFVEKRYAQAMSLPAVFWVMDSASGASPERLAQIEREAKTSLFGNAMNLCFPEVDDAWGTPDLGESFRAPLTSDVRTLFISGTIDSNTPPAQSDEIARGFSNAHHFVIQNAGHEDLLSQPKMLAVVRKFLAGQDVSDPKIELPVPTFSPVEGSTGSVRHPAIPRGR